MGKKTWNFILSQVTNSMDFKSHGWKKKLQRTEDTDKRIFCLDLVCITFHALTLASNCLLWYTFSTRLFVTDHLTA